MISPLSFNKKCMTDPIFSWFVCERPHFSNIPVYAYIFLSEIFRGCLFSLYSVNWLPYLCVTTGNKGYKRSTFRTIKYMNGSIFSKARYMNGIVFEIHPYHNYPRSLHPAPPPSPPPTAPPFRNTPVPQLTAKLSPSSPPGPPPPPPHTHTHRGIYTVRFAIFSLENYSTIIFTSISYVHIEYVSGMSIRTICSSIVLLSARIVHLHLLSGEVICPDASVKLPPQIWPNAAMINQIENCLFLSSPEPKAQHELLWLLLVRRSSSIVRPSVRLCVRPSIRPHIWTTSPLMSLKEFSLNFMWSLLSKGNWEFVQMVTVRCIRWLTFF